ncbi:MAG: mercury methylation ferredoxin HgcB [Candidatus Hodarchaeota archaeon]
MFGLKYLKNVVTLKLDQEKCTGCRMCTIVCPHRVFSMNGKKAMILDRNACMECGACARNCPAMAIFVNAGVGCATAVINSKLKRKEAACCNIESDTVQQNCSCCQ